MTNIQKLIELAEKATRGEWHTKNPEIGIYSEGILFAQFTAVYRTDLEYIAAACPANLLPLLKCAQKMARALYSVGTEAPSDYMGLVVQSLKEWDELNK